MSELSPYIIWSREICQCEQYPFLMIDNFEADFLMVVMTRSPYLLMINNPENSSLHPTEQSWSQSHVACRWP